MIKISKTNQEECRRMIFKPIKEALKVVDYRYAEMEYKEEQVDDDLMVKTALVGSFKMETNPNTIEVYHQITCVNGNDTEERVMFFKEGQAFAHRSAFFACELEDYDEETLKAAYNSFSVFKSNIDCMKDYLKGLGYREINEVYNGMIDNETGLIIQVFENHIETVLHDKTVMTEYSFKEPKEVKKIINDHEGRCADVSAELHDKGIFTLPSLMGFLMENSKTYIKLNESFAWKHRYSGLRVKLTPTMAIFGHYVSTYEDFDMKEVEDRAFEFPF